MKVKYGLRQMNREWSSQTLAREDGMLDPDEGTQKAEMGEPELEPRREVREGSPHWEERSPRRGQVSWDLPPSPEMGRRNPIGALPAAEEPLPHARLTELLGDAQRYLGMIRSGARDIATAAVKLAKLPVDIALMAAHKVRPLRA